MLICVCVHVYSYSLLVSLSVCVSSFISVSRFLPVLADEDVHCDSAVLHLLPDVRVVFESEHQRPHAPPVRAADQP